MVEYIASQDRCLLNIEANYYNQLDIEAFSQMMKDPSYCYKFYWLEAVVHIISEGKNETTFDEIINEMIANAWYSVREFHIHLSGIQADGLVRDGLERAILQLTEKVCGRSTGFQLLFNAKSSPHGKTKRQNRRAAHMERQRAPPKGREAHRSGSSAVCFLNI